MDKHDGQKSVYKKGKNHSRLAIEYLLKNWSSRIGLGIIAFWLLIAFFAQLITSSDPNKQSLSHRLAPPSWTSQSTETTPNYFLGADQLGRDIFSRILFGARVSLIVGFASALLSSILGIVVGALAGFFGGWLDELLMGIADLQLAFPTILLALGIMAVLGPGISNIVIVFTMTGWVQYARTLRSEILKLKNLEFVTASKIIGAKQSRILVKHIMPNALAPLIVIGSFQVAQMITQEAALSFFGVGVPATVPSWGSMISDGREFIRSAWWLTTIPGLCLMSIVAGINFLGDTLRDALDPLNTK